MGAAVVGLGRAVRQGRGWWRRQRLLASASPSYQCCPEHHPLCGPPSLPGQGSTDSSAATHRTCCSPPAPLPPGCTSAASPCSSTRTSRTSGPPTSHRWAGQAMGQVGDGRGRGMQGWLVVGSKQHRQHRHCWWQARFAKAHSRWANTSPTPCTPALLSTVRGSVRRQEGGARPRPLPPGALRWVCAGGALHPEQDALVLWAGLAALPHLQLSTLRSCSSRLTAPHPPTHHLPTLPSRAGHRRGSRRRQQAAVPGLCQVRGGARPGAQCHAGGGQARGWSRCEAAAGPGLLGPGSGGSVCG